MATIDSVLGPIDTSDLGFTLMHEHLIVASAGIPQNLPELLGADFMDRITVDHFYLVLHLGNAPPHDASVDR